MMKLKNISSNIKNIFKNININFIIYIIFSNLLSVHISIIYDHTDNIIIFNHKKFKAGNFATNKNGELFIEYYSEDDNDIPASRLFYVRQKNGRELFLNESSSTQEINIGLDETIDIFGYNYFNIYDSKNLFVTIKNELNKENQYLFSINSYDSIVELHKFNNNINTAHYLWNFYDFFNLNIKQYIFPYETFLFELKEESSYIIAFIPKMYVNEDMKELSFIKKFRFKTFNEDAYEEITTIEYNRYINNRILSAFLVDDKYLVVISLKEIEKENENNDDFWDIQFRFNISLYLNMLDSFKYGFNELFYITEFYVYSIDEIFFKAFYLQKGFTLFACINGGETLWIYLYEISYSKGALQYKDSLQEEIWINNEILIDFIKISERKLAFITNLELEATRCMRRNIYNYGSLYILLIEIHPDFPIFRKKKAYHIQIENYMPIIQISGFMYNDFLLFTSTAIPLEEGYYFGNDNYLSMFMIFGYPNGTDIIIDDISFLFYSDYFDEGLPEEGFPFYDILLDDFFIENNIFDYIPADIIKLVSIPDELILYEINQDEDSIIRKQNNSEIYESYCYKIMQNTNLIKTSKYYYIDYQYIAQEELNPEEHNQEKPKLFYGRINRLEFKLCHDFCETCYEIGIFNDIQNCQSCLPNYQFNYFYFSESTEENKNICVPEGYYYDIDNEKITQCNEDSKYYVNTTDNKTICFKDVYSCPPSYPFYNETTKECFAQNEPNSNQEKFSEHYNIIFCQLKPYIKNEECFNNLIMFDNKKYLLNNFAQTKNGDILIQFNEYYNFDELNSSRLFYGLTKKGNYFFSNSSSYNFELNINISKEIIENNDFLTLYEMQNSKSLLVSTKDDIIRENQYLFSINSEDSMVELYDLNKDNNNYHVWSFFEFFNLDENDYFFPFKYELFDLKEKSKYIIAFIPPFKVDQNIIDVSFIKKFIFKSFDNEAYKEIISINYENFLNNKIINIIFLEESKALSILTFNEILEEGELSEEQSDFNPPPIPI